MPTSAKAVRLGSLAVSVERRLDGSTIVRSTEPMPLYPDKITERLEHWARVAPQRTFIAKRMTGGEWRRMTYSEALAEVRSIAMALLGRALSPHRPIMLLSGNDIEHAMLSLAAMYIGQPFAPISPAYSLVSTDFGKLKDIAGRLRPQVVFADDAGRYGRAIDACFPVETEVVATRGSTIDRQTTAFAALLRHAPDASVDVAHATVGPDTIAKILFTSGSTGMPKGVITTQRMLTSNQAIMRHWLAFVEDEPPVLVDWLPWNHTFGGSHNFGLVLANGGTLYIDDGKPVPGGMRETLRNLRDVSPTMYFNVPRGYEELVAALSDDKALCETFFRKLRLTFYAAASLPRHTANELDRLAIATTGERVLMVTGFGATETAPSMLGTTLATSGGGNIGLPLPGVAVKLVPVAGKLEARVHSPSLMPGYWEDAANSTQAFDDEGFYRLGDAVKFADVDDPAQGFLFDGRITEDFKLSSGTWVSAGPLRVDVIAAFMPLVKDVVITGHDRNDLGALLFPDLDACRRLLTAAETHISDAELLACTVVRTAFRQRLANMARASTGSSMRIGRIVVLDQPPSIDANEITDKGSVNQRAVLLHRSQLVDDIYAARPSARVIALQ